jgi:hypothetical protein
VLLKSCLDVAVDVCGLNCQLLPTLLASALRPVLGYLYVVL